MTAAAVIVLVALCAWLLARAMRRIFQPPASPPSPPPAAHLMRVTLPCLTTSIHGDQIGLWDSGYYAVTTARRPQR